MSVLPTDPEFFARVWEMLIGRKESGEPVCTLVAPPSSRAYRLSPMAISAGD
jgi:hypothetical protein